jgi:hypothetical protein
MNFSVSVRPLRRRNKAKSAWPDGFEVTPVTAERFDLAIVRARHRFNGAP